MRAFIDYTKAFDCVDHDKLWKILKKMGIPDHLTRLLRNLYAGQEATVRIAQESSPTPQFKIISSLALSFLYTPTLISIYDHWENPKLPSLLYITGNPACRGTFGGRRKAVRDRLALQGGTGDFP